MELIFNSTKRFEKSLEQVPHQNREKIVEKINQLAHLFISDPILFFQRASQCSDIQFDDLESSLYVAQLSEKDQILLTIDDDPIFDQVIFTLFALTTCEQLEQDLVSIKESLYQNKIHGQAKEVTLSGAV
ncbi:MAG: hypothetical protein RLZZ490_245 [Cyanobacteriota bacterium]